MAGLEQGAIVAKRYRLESVLGEGGMGVVWAATHLVTHKPVALKFLRDGASNPMLRRRFLREARAASAVDHPNVVRIHDVLELEDGGLAMSMDYLVGETLRGRLDRVKKLTLVEMATLLAPALSAVGTAHAIGIIHRDLKPENIFLVEPGADARVLDFGIAKLTSESAELESAALTATGALLGTPYYMSPEQVFGEKDIDARADVWAFGVILYECLAGRRPIEGDNAGQIVKGMDNGTLTPLRDLAPGVPAEVADVITEMLQRDREARSPDLRAAFDVLRDHATIPSRSFATARPPKRLSTNPGSARDRVGLAETVPATSMAAFGAPNESVAGRASAPTVAASEQPDRTAAAVESESRVEPQGVSKRGLVIGLALAAAAVVVFLGLRSGEAPTAPAVTGAPPDAPRLTIATADVTVVSPPEPTAFPSTTASAAAPDASAEPRPSASAVAGKKTPHAPPPPGAPGTAPATPPPPTTLPGGVYGEKPF